MKTKQAFTLIELIVVIAIISILALLTVPNFSSATRRARDARQMSDVSNIQQALVMYRSDKGNYPINQVAMYNSSSNPSNPGLATDYIAKMPLIQSGQDKGKGYYYTCTETAGSKCYKFLLCTGRLEYAPGGKGKGNNTSATTMSPCTDTADCLYYCVTSP